MSELFLLLLIFLVALLLQALFAGYETGFVSSNTIRVRYLAEEERSSSATRLLRAIDKPDRMLTTLLIGTNLTVVVCTLVVSSGVNMLLDNLSPGTARAIEDVVSMVIVAPLLLVFAEIIPKSVFRTHPTRLTLIFFPVINAVSLVLAPLAVPVSWVTGRMLRFLGGKHQHLSPLMTSLEEIRTLVDEGVDQGTIEPEEQEMIHSVIDLQSTTAREIMVPRIAIRALPETAVRDDLVRLFASSGHTRIPIYRDSVDSIVGVVNAYAILMDTEPRNQDIGRFVKDVMHVPDTMSVDELFRTMRKAKQHVAVVVDEYGGTDGIITIEDILEEIFGEIQDEYDHEESPIHKVGPSAYNVDARVSLEEVSETLGLEFRTEDVETLGGWMMLVAGHIPEQGEVVEHGRLRMTVLVGGANCVSRIRVEVLSEKLDESGRPIDR